MTPPAGLVVVRGPRAQQERVFDQLDALLPRGAGPELWALPVRLVVPSRSLRLHFASAFAHHRGQAVVGLVVQTLHQLAFDVLDRAGEAPPSGDVLFEVLVRRAAAREVALHSDLGHLDDGFGAVVSAARELLSAGLDLATLEPVVESLEQAGEGRSIRRALAIARAAVDAGLQMEHDGVGGPLQAIQRARDLLEALPQVVLPARAVIVVGDPSWSGAQADLVEALLRHRPTTVVLTRERDPAAPEADEPGNAAAVALVERLGGVRGVRVENAAPEPANLALWEAPGDTGECRAVAARIRSLLDGGACPEDIAVVMRTTRGTTAPLRRELELLGIPFSGVGALAAPGPAARRAASLAALVQRGPRTSADRWLDALSWHHELPRVPLSDLRLALATLGASRVDRAAAVDLDRVLGGATHFALPLRGGLDPHEGARARRRRLPAEALTWLVERARGLAGRWSAWPEVATAREHLGLLRDVLTRDLGWQGRDAPLRDVQDALQALDDTVPGSMDLSRQEVAVLVERALAGVGEQRLGGAGGGVQVLGADEARGRTWQHLFVLGLNRDAFPRPALDDPLLPDPVRLLLRPLLPDLGLQRERLDGERALFASLCDSAPQVVLSWQSVDDDGRARSPSPFVERLRWKHGATAIRAPFHRGRAVAADPAPRPAVERALLAGLYGGRAGFPEVLALALAEGGGGDAAAASARCAVLEEVDPDRRTRAGRAVATGPGPWTGLTGPLPGAHGEAWVTTIEAIARCPWQAFLERVLRLEPAPDPAAGLPTLDRRLVGTLAHRVLEDIGRTPTWPGTDEVAAAVQRHATALLTEAGVAFPGWDGALASLARPLVDVAARVDFPPPGPPVAGVEAEGRATLLRPDAPARVVAFLADRVDGGETPVFTDYKAGRPLSLARKPDTRRRHLLAEIRAGRRLQAAAYAHSEPGAVGRFLFLDPEAPDDVREVRIDSDDAEVATLFEQVVHAVLDGWQAGVAFPRLTDPTGVAEPDACGHCLVREACQRGDSGTRARIVAWLAAPEATGPAAALWRLGAPAGEDADED